MNRETLKKEFHIPPLRALKPLFTLLVEACQFPHELTGLEAEGSCHHMVSTLTVCLASVSAHNLPRGPEACYIFQTVASLGHGGTGAPSLEPRVPQRGLWVCQEQKRLPAFRDEVITPHGWPRPFPGRRRCFCVTSSLQLSHESSSPILHRAVTAV